MSYGNNPPQVATDAHGYATQLNPAAAGQVALAPGKIPADTVTYLDANALPASPRPGLPAPKAKKFVPVADSEDSLVDLSDKSFFAKSGATTVDIHTTTSDPVFALRTVNGGALVFYDLDASLTMGAPYAQPFRIKIPGFLNGTQQARAFTVNYTNQFAVYETPGSPSRLQGLGTYSGRLSSDCDGASCK
jgi:hypothetical protein